MNQTIKTFMVGGCVRDKIMNKQPEDIDYVVVGATEEDMLNLGFSKVGADFPVFLHPVTGDEFALARTERKSGVGYHGFEVKFDKTVTLEDDLIRRDLTINSMAMDEDGNIIDPYGGKADIELKILRHTSDAFKDDPVRVLRLGRFYARFGFGWTIAESTMNLCREVVNSGELEIVPDERIWAEFQKGLETLDPMRMINFLVDIGFFEIEKFKKLRPSAMITALSFADTNRYDKNVRLKVNFGIIFGHVAEEDLEVFKAPASVKEIAVMVNTFTKQIRNWDFLSSEEQLLMIERMDAIRRWDRFACFIEAVNAISYFIDGNPLRCIGRMVKMAKRLKDADYGLVAKEAMANGKSIPEAVKNYRLSIVESHNFKWS